jgi:hypothetical protein
VCVITGVCVHIRAGPHVHGFISRCCTVCVHMYVCGCRHSNGVEITDAQFT